MRPIRAALNEIPLATITGLTTLLNNPVGVALDAGGKIYVTIPATPSRSMR